MSALVPVPDAPDDDFGRPDPHDIAAEQAVLGSMMISAAAATACMSALAPDDFYRPAHGLIFGHITAMIRSRLPVDAVTVNDRITAAGESSRMGGPPYLHTLIATVPTAANSGYYSGIVRERAVRRRLLSAGRRIVQWAGDGSGEAHGLTGRALREIETVRDSGLGDGLTVKTITEFMDVPPDADKYDWVVEGLLERTDRFMLTGAEGAGKSTLMRQLAVTIAAGIHPFTHRNIEPCRVMVIDSQDSGRQMRRKFGPMLERAEFERRPVRESNLWIEDRGRMDLALDRDASWLMRQVATVRPDAVMMGPLVNLAPRALNSDDDAAPIVAVLDTIREHNACLILEAHAGHALGVGGRRDMRPRGSSTFLGWPEFGYGMRWTDDPQGKVQRTVDFVGWRGDRDERNWPVMLTAGGAWPWKTYNPVSAGWDEPNA